MEKLNQQSRLGWGGKRKGAGAPFGNTNAVKHGERSRRAFFPLEGGDDLSPLVKNRARNLILAERLGELWQQQSHLSAEQRREMMLILGMMGQHTDRIMKLELMKAHADLAGSKLMLNQAKQTRKRLVIQSLTCE